MSGYGRPSAPPGAPYGAPPAGYAQQPGSYRPTAPPGGYGGGYNQPGGYAAPGGYSPQPSAPGGYGPGPGAPGGYGGPGYAAPPGQIPQQQPNLQQIFARYITLSILMSEPLRGLSVLNVNRFVSC